jgi:hypothetical protein
MVDELDYIGVMTNYDKIGFHVTPDQVVGRKILACQVTGRALTAATWTVAHTAANAVSASNQQLETGRKYAVAWVYAYSATGIAVRVTHNSWGSCKPGGMLGTTVYHKKNMLDFAKHGSLPVFPSSNPLQIECFDSATATPIIVVGLIDVTDIGGSPGMEDFNLAYGTTTNTTTTFTVFTVAGGDTFYIKDVESHGVCRLRGAFMTGTKPLRGQLRSTDPAFQPNPVELPYGFCTVAGDFLSEVMFPLPELRENSLLIAQGTS